MTDKMPEKAIGYGLSIYNKIKIKSIHINNQYETVVFVTDKGRTIEMTMEFALDQGIINLEPLLKLLK